MTSKPIELRQVILDSVCCCGDFEQATDAIIDAVIAALPKPKPFKVIVRDYYNIGSASDYKTEAENHLNMLKKDVVNEIKTLLEQAKENK